MKASWLYDKDESAELFFGGGVELHAYLSSVTLSYVESVGSGESGETGWSGGHGKSGDRG